MKKPIQNWIKSYTIYSKRGVKSLNLGNVEYNENVEAPHVHQHHLKVIYLFDAPDSPETLRRDVRAAREEFEDLRTITEEAIEMLRHV